MKITKIHIDCFGKLKEKEYEIFSPLTTFILDNGEGKSTLLHFIRAMFYGVGVNNLSSLRGRYLPWGESKAAGYIEFEANEIKYRLSRSFGKSKKNDEESLFNLSNNEKETIIEETYGKHFFHVDESTFLKTLCVSHKQLEFTNDEKLQNMLINAMNTGDADTSLKEAKNQFLIYSRIVDVNKKDSVAFLTLKESRELQSKIDELTHKNEEMNVLYTQLNNNEAQLKKYEEKARLYQKVREYQQDRIKYEEYREYITYLNEIANKEIKVDETNYEALLNRIQVTFEQKAKHKNFLTIYAGVFSLILAISLSFVSLYFLTIFILYGVALIVDLVLIKRQNRVIKSQKDILLKEYDVSSYAELLNKITLLKANQINYRQQEVLLKTSKFSNKEYVDSLLTYSNFTYVEEFENYPNMEEIINANLKEIKQCELVIAEARGGLKHNNSNEQLTFLLSKRKILEEKLNEYKEEMYAMNEAKDLIQACNDEICSNYTPQLKQYFKEELNQISNGKFADILINKDLKIFLDEGQDLHELEYYSQGYQDMVFMALRIALVKMSMEQENCLLLLDDPFINLDAKNKKYAIEYLKKLSSSYSIFYFSCNNL